MPRFILKDGAKTKFFEITLDGTTCTTLWGNEGSAPTKAVKQFASEDEGEKHVQKQVKDRIKKGFTEVGSNGKAPPPKTHVELPPAELKQHLKKIAADPASADAVLVFSDWLQGLGHPWGRLIAIQHALLGETAAKKRKVLADEEETLLRDDAAGLQKLASKHGGRFTWRRGFLETATIKGATGAELVAGITALFKSAAAHTLTTLILDAQPARLQTRRSWEDSADNIVEDMWDEVLAELPKKLPERITRLSFGASPPEPATAYVRMPDFARVSAAIPHVRALEVAGAARASNKPFNLPDLVSLDVRFAEATDEALRAVSGSKLPQLERLSVWLGAALESVLDDVYHASDYDPDDEDQERYPADYPASDLGRMRADFGTRASVPDTAVAAFLAGKLPKNLKELGIKSGVLDASTCEAIVGAPIIRQLTRLDLSGSELDDDAARALAKAKKELAHLEQIDLRRLMLRSDVLRGALAKALPNALFDDSKPKIPEFLFRYVATME